MRPGLIAVYDINQYNYAKHIFQVKSQYIPDTEANVLNVVLSTIDNTPVYYTFDGSEPTASSNIYTDTLKIGQSCTLKAITIRPNGSSVERGYQIQQSHHAADHHAAAH